MCLQKVIKEMTKRSNQLLAGCEHNAAFSLLYLRVTEALRDHISADPALFKHADFITHQDNLFAGMYWRAYDRWKAGQRAGVPGAWLVALDAAGSKSMPALGDLYLGINAHVLADLPVLLYQLGLSDENGDSRKPDHDAVNVVLRDIFEPSIHEIAQRLDPTMSMSDPLAVDDRRRRRALPSARRLARAGVARSGAAGGSTRRRHPQGGLQHASRTTRPRRRSRCARHSPTRRSSPGRCAQAATRTAWRTADRRVRATRSTV